MLKREKERERDRERGTHNHEGIIMQRLKKYSGENKFRIDVLHSSAQRKSENKKKRERERDKKRE